MIDNAMYKLLSEYKCRICNCRNTLWFTNHIIEVEKPSNSSAM